MILFYRSLWIVFCLFIFFPHPSQAEHTPEHRFTISGYVYDDAGKPVPGAVVIKDTTGGVLGSTEAGGSGYYSIQIHLHDSDAGKKLLIESEAGKKELVAKFNPNDKTTERLAEVNFGLVPASSGFMDNKPVIFGIAAVIGAGTVYFVTRKRKQRKRQPVKKKHKKGSQPAST